MRTTGRGAVWAGWVLVIGLLTGCSSNGQGSETHFVTCASDAECAANGQVCVASHCTPRGTSAGGSDAGSLGTSSAAGTGAGGTRSGSGGSTTVSHDSGVAGTVVDPGMPDSSSPAFSYFYGNAFSNFGTVFAVPKGAGSSVALVKGTAPVNIARAFTFDATSVYYSSEDTTSAKVSAKVVALPRSGAGAPRTIVSGLHVVEAVTVDATSLYFIDVDAIGTGATLIGKVPLRNDSPDGAAFETILPPQTVNVEGLTTYGDYVYWVKNEGGVSNLTGSIQRALKAGGPVETIASEVINARQVLVDGSGVYWLNGGHLGVDCTATDGDIRYLASGSTTPVVLVSNLAGAGSLVLAEGSLVVGVSGAYCNIVPPGSGSLFKVAIPSGTKTVLVPNVSGPDNLFFDGSDLYYTHVIDQESDILSPSMVKP